MYRISTLLASLLVLVNVLDIKAFFNNCCGMRVLVACHLHHSCDWVVEASQRTSSCVCLLSDLCDGVAQD